MSDENLQDKLAELENKREQVKAQIDESQSILDAIEEKIETVKRQSKERLLLDDRVDNKLVMSVHNKAASTDTTTQRSTNISGHENVVLVPTTLTETDITVTPKEQPEKE